MRFNIQRLKEDYNELRQGESIGLLYRTDNSPALLRRTFYKDGLEHEEDFRLRILPVLNPESIAPVAKLANSQVSEAEFCSYAKNSSRLYVNRTYYPNLHSIDLRLPRRSNKHLPTDSLPRVDRVYQVYIERISEKKFNLGT